MMRNRPQLRGLLNTLALGLGLAAAVLVLLNGALREVRAPGPAAAQAVLETPAGEAEASDAESHAHDHGDGTWCREHDLAEDECAICVPDRAAALAPGESLKLRLPSGASADKAGVTLETGSPAAAAPGVRAACRVAYNQAQLARIAPLAGGIVAEVCADLGDEVAAGQPLVRLTSPELAEALRVYREAEARRDLAASAYQREKSLHERGISSGRDFQEAAAEQRRAQAAAEAARQGLVLLGFDEHNGEGALTLRAPFAGTIIERNAVAGEAVERGAALFTVADLSSMWIELSLPQTLMYAVRVGDTVQARFEALPGEPIEARVDWVAPSLEEDSRTLRARAVAANAAGLLKQGMYGEISTGAGAAGQTALQLPSDAVHYYDGLPFVFVRVEDDLFDVRRVVAGASRDSRIEILDGLRADDRVVTGRSHVLKSEFLKSRLGAGCVDD